MKRTEADATGVRQRIYGGGMAHLVSSGLDSEKEICLSILNDT